MVFIRRCGKKSKESKKKMITLRLELTRIWDMITSSWKENLYRLHFLAFFNVSWYLSACSACQCTSVRVCAYVFQGKIHVITLFITFYRICYDTPDQSWIFGQWDRHLVPWFYLYLFLEFYIGRCKKEKLKKTRRWGIWKK